MPRPTTRRARLGAVLTAVGLAACGAGEAASPASPPPTVGDIGELPDELSPPPTTSAPPTTDPVARPRSTSPAPPETIAGESDYRFPIGRTIDGNRLLVIGDSILAAISDRYGGQLCDRLVPLGWAVEVDAESGRDVTFGLQVLDDRLDAGWDAAVVMLGHNYRDDVQQFAADMEEIVRRLAPRPTLLLTVTEFEPSRSEVNFVIRSLGHEYDNVRIVEWAERTRDAEELLGDDGLHLSEQGRLELATQIARPLLRVAGTGECLGSDYDDDSQAPDVDLGDDGEDGEDGDVGDDGWTPPAQEPDPGFPPLLEPGPAPDPDPAPDPTAPPPAPPVTDAAPPPPATDAPTGS
jgi:lysophospholipase L1-like esterase